MKRETKSAPQPVYTIIVFLIEPIITNYKEEPPITPQGVFKAAIAQQKIFQHCFHSLIYSTRNLPYQLTASPVTQKGN